MSKDMTRISKQELVELLSDSIQLSILEADGVDNWDWYMAGKDQFMLDFINDNDHFADWYRDNVNSTVSDEELVDTYHGDIDYRDIAQFMVDTSSEY